MSFPSTRQLAFCCFFFLGEELKNGGGPLLPSMGCFVDDFVGDQHKSPFEIQIAIRAIFIAGYFLKKSKTRLVFFFHAR